MESEIKITAHADAHRPDTCKLEVSVPLYADRAAFFADKEKAKHSPLAEKLFAIKSVGAVKISGSSVTITKHGDEAWRSVNGKVAGAILEFLKSGQPAVSKDYVSNELSPDQLRVKVQEIFDSEINPAVADHGGVVTLLNVKDNNIYLRMGGGCQGCGMADVTLRQGIETAIRKSLPQVNQILDVTDHASGGNPYYAPSKK